MLFSRMNEYMTRYDEEPGGNGGGSGGQSGTTTPITFESWYGSLGDEHKALVEDHVKGLKSALDSERSTRKTAEAQLREAAKKAEAGSAAQQELTKLADQYAEAERQAAFFEQAHTAGVRNLRLAWVAAREADLVDSKGRVNFEELRKQFPELFGETKKNPASNAGNGTNGQNGGGSNENNPAPSMNAFIRRAAGRQ